MRRVLLSCAIGILTAASVTAATTGGAGAEPRQDATGYPLTVPNPSFEDATDNGKPADWTLEPDRPQTASVTADAAHSGSHSLLVDNPDGSLGPAVHSTKLTAHAGTTYTATAWAQGKSGTVAWLYLEFFDADGARLAAVHVTPSFSDAWQQVTTSGTAPADTATLDVLIYGSHGTSGVSYYDDVTVSGNNPPSAPYDPQIGSQTQLFTDGYRIKSMTDASLVVHQARKMGTVMTFTKPWETTDVYVYGSVIYDSAKRVYQMWYTSYDSSKGVYHLCYATSRDGRTWDKPDLGIYSYNGSTANNIVGDYTSATVLKDDDDPDPARRYKMFSFVGGSGYWVWYSPDGLHWTPYQDNPVLPNGDVGKAAYDPATKTFIATTKDVLPDVGRVAYMSTSTDFEHWTAPKLVMEADARDNGQAQAMGLTSAQIYGLPVLPYKGIYVGLPWVYYLNASKSDGPVDTQLAFSRDLYTWTRSDRTPAIQRGVGGSFDSGMVFTASDVIQKDGRIWLYYGGWDGTHGSHARVASIGLASWREDGFTSIANGGDKPGVVTTKPLVFTGTSLHVNVDVSGRGHSLAVEVLDENGSVIPGFGLDDAVPVRGDHLDATVTWHGNPDLSALAGKKIELRFHLTGGDLYSYHFGSR